MTLTQLSSESSLPPPPPPHRGLNAFWELTLSFVNAVAKSPWNNWAFPFGFCLCSGDARHGRKGGGRMGESEVAFWRTLTQDVWFSRSRFLLSKTFWVPASYLRAVLTEAAEAAQRGVAMQTRLSMCAVSPETQGALQLQKLAVGASEGPAWGCRREEVVSVWLWGLRGCPSSPALEGKTGSMVGILNRQNSADPCRREHF